MLVRVVVVVVVLLTLGMARSPGVAAPLPGGDPEAQDAVALLRAMGIVEEDPRGGFRGDRAISRWEAAATVARALGRMEAARSELLSRTELQELMRVGESLRDELEALGVRVQSLEEAAERLDSRVESLGRITFSGQFLTSLVSQGVVNRGNNVSGFGPAALDYDRVVGTLTAGNLVPHGPQGVLPVIDFGRGRPLTTGTGFTSLLYLTADIRPDEDWSGDVRVFAFSSQGDSVVGAVWGVSPPYLANSFTGNDFPNPARLNHTPYTTTGLDRLRFTYHPAAVTLTLGSYETRFISPQVFMGEVNPAVGDPRVLDNYGFHLAGEQEPWGWEVFGTQLGEGNPGVNGVPYRDEALGGALTWSQDEWRAGLSFLRAANQSIDGSLLTVGQVANVNGAAGQINVNWVNPNGFFVDQLGGVGSPNVAGPGTTSDKRPIPGVPGLDAGFPAGFGPQGITMAGLSLDWTGEEWAAFGEYAFSEYRPSRNADYSVHGDLWRLGGRGTLEEGRLELEVDYRSADPTYDPMMLTFPAGATALTVTPFRVYHRLPDQDQFWNLYSLHNTDSFPHNRRGWWLQGRWQYEPEAFVQLQYRALEQVETSLQDVRFPAGSLGPGTPNVTVLGHSPGFFDMVFREYSPLSFDASLGPLEDQRGTVDSWRAELSQVFTGTPWRVDAFYDVWHFHRPSDLPPSLGGSQNLVDLTNSYGRISAGYQAADNLLLTVGYERARMRGHYDSFGVYNPVAIALGSNDFVNRDTLQHIPFVQAHWNVAEGVKLGADLHLYDTHDLVDPALFAGTAGGPFAAAHPFEWRAYRLGTTFEVSF
ncbi:MAG: hypothetical protein HY319_01315 [Armatimonadetes bacterium]|nr:hypothetical protein [Armatimonadota bacterium]